MRVLSGHVVARTFGGWSRNRVVRQLPMFTYWIALIVCAVLGLSVGHWIDSVAALPNMAAMMVFVLIPAYLAVVAAIGLTGIVLLLFRRVRTGAGAIGIAVVLAAAGYAGSSAPPP